MMISGQENKVTYHKKQLITKTTSNSVFHNMPRNILENDVKMKTNIFGKLSLFLPEQVRGGWIHYLITKIKRGAYSIEYSFPNLLHLCIILVALLLKQN